MPLKPTPRRGPKNAARLSKEERDARDKEETEKRQQREQQARNDMRAAEAERRKYLGLGDAGRGRGDSRGGPRRAQGRGGRGGHFGSSGPRFAPAPQGRGGPSFAPVQAGPSTARNAKREPQVKSDPEDDPMLPPGFKNEYNNPMIIEDSDEEQGRQRIDVHGAEVLDVPIDDDEEAAIAKANGFYGGNMRRPTYPIRVKRTEHKARAVGINADASLAVTHDVKRQADAANDGEGGRTKRNPSETESSSEQPEFKGVYIDEETAAVKVDPDETEDDKARRQARERDATRSSPKASRKTPARRARSPVPQTEEEKLERDLEKNEAARLKAELGQKFQDQGSGDRADGGQDAANDRANANYLIQLPPVLPELLDPNEKVKAEHEASKPEEEKTSGSKPAADVETIVKPDVDGEAEQSKDVPPPKSGRIGKLRVHRSGKVTLSWGGTSMEVREGTDAFFLQSIVLTEASEPATAGAASVPPSSRALCFGQVRGKMVVTPDWDAILQ